MKTFVFAAALGAALMAFVGLAHASIPDPLGVVHTCVNPNSGDWKVIDSAAGTCKGNEQALDLNQKGPKGDKGDPGTFNGTLSSPNGQFILKVEDAGISLSGPSGSVKVGPTTISVNGAIVDIQAAGKASLGGGITSIGCSTGGVPITRANDQVAVTVGAGGGGTGIILPGATTVTAC